MPQDKVVYVIGAGGHGKVVIRTLQELGFVVAAVFDDDEQLAELPFCGTLVKGTTEMLAEMGRVPAVIAIGDNLRRQSIANRFNIDWLTIIHPRAFVDRTARIGAGTVVLAGAVVQAGAVLGSHVIVNTSASVDHDCNIASYAHVGPGVRLAGHVCVGEGTLLGIGAVAIPSRQIGSWSIIGAGSTVIKDIPAAVVATGAPAEPVRTIPTKVERMNSLPTAFPAGREPGERAADRNVFVAVYPHETSHSMKIGKIESSAIPSQSDNQFGSNQALGAAAKPSRIYLSPPHMSGQEREFLLEAFDSNWIAPLGPHVDKFETEFAEKVGVPYAVALSSGTAALHLALIVLGIGAGDEVATSSLTFVASANAIRYVGATPVFIDSERNSWNLDPSLLEKELNAATQRGVPLKAVLAVDVCGQCADFARIREICRQYEIPLIEDAAEALGATYLDQPAGSFGDIGCFSFNGNKIITTSGGGMLVTRREELADKARYLATQARDQAPHYEHSQIGFNYRMSNLLAAVGRGQLRVLSERVAQRRANFRYYQATLGDLPGLSFMPEHEHAVSTRWLTCIVIDPDQFGATREDVRLALEQENIESRPVWKPMHLQPVYASCRIRGGDVSEELFRNGLCLPSGSNLTPLDLSRVVTLIRSMVG